MIQWKLCCRSQEQKRNNQPITRPGIKNCHWFILALVLRLRQSSFHLIVSKGDISRISVLLLTFFGLIFTTSYRSTLLITTPTTPPSLVPENQPSPNQIQGTSHLRKFHHHRRSRSCSHSSMNRYHWYNWNFHHSCVYPQYIHQYLRTINNNKTHKGKG